jgi:hypothetical protein
VQYGIKTLVQKTCNLGNRKKIAITIVTQPIDDLEARKEDILAFMVVLLILGSLPLMLKVMSRFLINRNSKSLKSGTNITWDNSFGIK